MYNSVLFYVVFVASCVMSKCKFPSLKMNGRQIVKIKGTASTLRLLTTGVYGAPYTPSVWLTQQNKF